MKTKYWHWLISKAICFLFFDRVKTIYPENLVNKSPILYIALNQNGPTDSWLYYSRLPQQFPDILFAQLRANFFSQLFFTGIDSVSIKNSKSQPVNQTILNQCVKALRAQINLIIFPEEEGSLGPRHATFHKNAAHVIQSYVEQYGSLTIQPIGIRYTCPWLFGSRAEVCIGKAEEVFWQGQLTKKEQLDYHHDKVTNLLEKIGINVDTHDYHEQIKELAFIANFDNEHSYYSTLKTFETFIPSRLSSLMTEYQAQTNLYVLKRNCGVATYPIKPAISLLMYACILPLWFINNLVNCCPLLTAYLAGKHKSDGLQSVTLWRILLGFPVFVSWICLVNLLILLNSDNIVLCFGYTCLSFASAKLSHCIKKQGVSLYNWLKKPSLRPMFLNLRQHTLQQVTNLNTEQPKPSANKLPRPSNAWL